MHGGYYAKFVGLVEQKPEISEMEVINKNDDITIAFYIPQRGRQEAMQIIQDISPIKDIIGAFVSIRIQLIEVKDILKKLADKKLLNRKFMNNIITNFPDRGGERVDLNEYQPFPEELIAQIMRI